MALDSTFFLWYKLCITPQISCLSLLVENEPSWPQCDVDVMNLKWKIKVWSTFPSFYRLFPVTDELYTVLLKHSSAHRNVGNFWDAARFQEFELWSAAWHSTTEKFKDFQLAPKKKSWKIFRNINRHFIGCWFFLSAELCFTHPHLNSPFNTLVPLFSIKESEYWQSVNYHRQKKLNLIGPKTWRFVRYGWKCQTEEEQHHVT